MKVFRPILWGAVPGVDYGADAIELARVVPHVGESRWVYLDKYDRVKDGQAISCIWSPPFTDINGWIEQPSEIASSYVVTGTAILKSQELVVRHTESSEYFQDVASTSLALEINVQSVRPLIDTLALAAPDDMFRLPKVGTCSGGSMPVWLGSKSIKSANVVGYIYLTARYYESQLEALLRIRDGQVGLVYHQYWASFCEMDCVILNKCLDEDERALFEHLIAAAEPISDTYKNYLV